MILFFEIGRNGKALDKLWNDKFRGAKVETAEEERVDAADRQRGRSHSRENLIERSRAEPTEI